MFNFYLPDGIEKARTVSFAVLAFTELFNVYNMRSLRKSIFEIGFFSNKWVNIATFVSLILLLGVLYLPFTQNIFSFSQLTGLELIGIIVISSLVLVVGEVYKKIKK